MIRSSARHTSAVLDLRAGTDIKVVSSRLGHAKVATTYDIYLHTPQDLEDEAAERRRAAGASDQDPQGRLVDDRIVS